MDTNLIIEIYKSWDERISKKAFIGAVWGSFAVATIFTGLRCFVRLRTFKRFYLDDAFVLIAWTILLAMVILWQAITAEDLYFMDRIMRAIQDFIAAGGDLFANRNIRTRSLQDDEAAARYLILARLDRFSKTHIALLFLFFTTLWCIKLSFLFFFRRLYLNMGTRLWIWWAIFIFTIAAWVCCVGTIDYRCFTTNIATDQAQYCATMESYNLQYGNFLSSCILDILTDIAITCIPISMLWKVRISGRRKAGLAVVFCGTIITMVISVIRISLTSPMKFRADTSWVYFWSSVEICIALIVACLGSFRSLFLNQDSAVRGARQPETAETRPARRRRPVMRNIANLFTTSRDSARSRTGSDTLEGIIDMYGTENRTRRDASDLESGSTSPAR